MFNKRDRNEVRRIRHERVRKKISGTPTRPRLCVYRSNAHIYAQVIDDEAGNTLAAASTVEKDTRFKSWGSSSSSAKMAEDRPWERSSPSNISRPVGSASAVSTARSVRERFIVVVNAPF